jgi:response regulator RpfG family c-di-GMP phosphodiesterase
MAYMKESEKVFSESMSDFLIEDEDSYVLFPIIQILKNAEFYNGSSFYVLLGEKFIKLNNSGETFADIFSSLLVKGVTHVHMKNSDLEALVNIQLQKMELTSEKFNDEIYLELQMKNLETAQVLAQTFILNAGFPSEVKSMIECSNRTILSILKEAPDIKARLEKFRINCSHQFYKSIFTHYVSSLILNHYPWRSSLFLDKIMLASSLCDLSLRPEDVEDLEAYLRGEGPLTAKVKNHPEEVIELISSDLKLITQETITIIRQHHEKPDGRGFPLGINHSRIGQLSTILIVSQAFVDVVSDCDHHGKSYVDVATEISFKYQGGFFTKTCLALIKEISRLK